MNIFYLFGGLLLLICFAGVIGSVGVLLFGCLKKKGNRKFTLTIGGRGLCVSLLALGLVAGCNQLLWGPTTDATSVYKHAFNAAPPASITNLQGIAIYGPDCAERVLQFTTDEATFRLLLPKHLSRKDTEIPKPNVTPEWWTPSNPAEAEAYHHSSDFAHRATNAVAAFESTTMTWNPKTGLIQYVWKAVD
jgi:hypothetical protein